MTRFQKTDVGELARRLADDAEGFCRHFFPNGCKVGTYWQMADTSGAKGRSLCVRLKPSAGRPAGKWVDYASGEYGDLLDLLESHLNPVSYPALLDAAESYLGDRPRVARTDGEDDSIRSKSRRRSAGRKLFSYGRPIIGTIAEHYLRNRQISRFGQSLAYHPSAFLRGDDGRKHTYPTLLAAIEDNDGGITGCSRIFLDPRTHGLADIAAPKRVLGQLYGNGIRLGRWRTATDLIIGEGLENVLSVGTVFPMAALTSCLTATHLAAFLVPSPDQRLWIAHDRDDAGERAAATLRDRLEAQGGRAFLLTPRRNDFNADLQEDGVTALRQRLAAVISAQNLRHDLWPLERAA